MEVDENMDNLQSHLDSSSEDEPTQPTEVEGPQDVGGFTVLGDFKPKEKQQVSRVLPGWLRWPVVIPEAGSSTYHFSDIKGLSPVLLDKLKEKGLSDCFPVQWTVIPELLAQSQCGLYAGDAGFRPRDVCVSAPTGSGKTLTFALPIIQALQGRVVPHVRALVILPVRDLALQVFKVFEEYTKDSNLKVTLLAGKKDFGQEQKSLVIKKKSSSGSDLWFSATDIVVATRGRLLDHIDCTAGFDLTHLRFLVIDEADRQMEDIHNDWLDQIETAIQTAKPGVGWVNSQENPGHCTVAASKEIKKYAQKLLFSATLSQNPELLERLNLFMPRLFTTIATASSATAQPSKGKVEPHFEVGDKFSTPATLQEKFLDCKTSEKPLLLLHFILNKKYRHVLCFTNSVESAHRLYLLTRQIDGVKVAEISSNVHTEKRERIIRQFARGTLQLLICSDVMTRGIDIENVQYVISYDAPAHIETYIHRVGRTARAHKSGTAITFLEGKEMYHFKKQLRESGRWSKMKRLNVNRNHLQPLLPQFTSALKHLPDILKEQKRKQKEL